MNFTVKNTFLRLAVLTLAALLALPTLALAGSQGRGKGKGHGKDKKSEKFVNGHDARDGRLDGRGPRRDRDDDDDDDDDDFDRGRGRGRGRDRDRDDDGIDDRRERRAVDRIAESNGYREGYRAGSEDSANGERYNFRDETAFSDATTGYRNEYGDVSFYRRNFREGFQRGYNDGYRNRDRRGDRDHDGIRDRQEIRAEAVRNGYNEGYNAGRNDRQNNRGYDFDDHSAYRDANIGYRNEYGDVSFYRRNFQEGFRRGYDDGYRNRSSRSGTIGDILGGIFGRQ